MVVDSALMLFVGWVTLSLSKSCFVDPEQFPVGGIADPGVSVCILCIRLYLLSSRRSVCMTLVSPCYRRWCNNLNEPLDPFPFLGGC